MRIIALPHRVGESVTTIGPDGEITITVTYVAWWFRPCMWACGLLPLPLAWKSRVAGKFHRGYQVAVTGPGLYGLTSEATGGAR